jgi:hypothetical protein
VTLAGSNPVRTWVENGARAVLLAGATVLAFYTGGYFDGPRITAAIVAWVLVAIAALLYRSPLPCGPGARLALIGLALLAGWTLASIGWTPIAGTAYHDGQRLVLYLGILIAAAALLRDRRALRCVEPALAGGVLIVIGYGISGRLVPGILHFSASTSAQGRLEQPLTYWNAMGELAALGFVLAVRLAGDATRRRALRTAAAAGAPALMLGLYLSFSRGALFASAAGLVTIVIVAPQRAQAYALARVLAAGVLLAVISAPFKGVTSLGGSLSSREAGGAVVLVALLVISAASAYAQWRLGERDPAGDLRLPRRAPLIAVGLICVGLALAIVVGDKQGTAEPLAQGSSRLVSLQSNRYDYWKVALRAFAHEPLYGVGAGGWAVWWLRYRPLNEGAQDAHSLELQTLAELGIVGLAMLAAFLAGIGLAARAAHRLAPSLSAGAIAALVVYLAHSPLDWDWEMPAVTLVAIVLGGAILALPDAVRARRPAGEANG